MEITERCGSGLVMVCGTAAGVPVAQVDPAALEEAVSESGPGLRVVVTRTDAAASASVRRSLTADLQAALTGG